MPVTLLMPDIDGLPRHCRHVATLTAARHYATLARVDAAFLMPMLRCRYATIFMPAHKMPHRLLRHFHAPPIAPRYLIPLMLLPLLDADAAARRVTPLAAVTLLLMPLRLLMFCLHVCYCCLYATALIMERAIS